MSTNLMLAATSTGSDDIVALLLAYMGILSVIMLVWYILQIVANWKIFAKAGEAGWKSIIPFYNQYVMYKIASKKGSTYFWIYLAASVVGVILARIGGIGATLSSLVMLVATVVNVLVLVKLTKAFGKGTGFAVGLVLLNPIFSLILAFGSAQYQGAQD